MRSFIYDFQLALYNALWQESNIKDHITKIYLYATRETQYPFLLINIIRINNMCNIHYDMEFEICLFSRNRDYSIAHMVESISRVVISEKFDIPQCIIKGIKLDNTYFSHSQDSMTYKIVMRYNALVQIMFC